MVTQRASAAAQALVQQQLVTHTSTDPPPVRAAMKAKLQHQLTPSQSQEPEPAVAAAVQALQQRVRSRSADPEAVRAGVQSAVQVPAQAAVRAVTRQPAAEAGIAMQPGYNILAPLQLEPQPQPPQLPTQPTQPRPTQSQSHHLLDLPGIPLQTILSHLGSADKEQLLRTSKGARTAVLMLAPHLSFTMTSRGRGTDTLCEVLAKRTEHLNLALNVDQEQGEVIALLLLALATQPCGGRSGRCVRNLHMALRVRWRACCLCLMFIPVGCCAGVILSRSIDESVFWPAGLAPVGASAHASSYAEASLQYCCLCGFCHRHYYCWRLVCVRLCQQ